MSFFRFKLATLTGLPIPTPAAVLAALLVLVGRVFFLAKADAFTPYPETQVEYNFYKEDLRCKATRPEAQVVIQGTSRLELVRKVPVFEKRWHTRDKMVNVSQPLNTFWHMNLLHRRNPGLLDATELWIMDVIPAQTRVAWGFTEYDALFLRESTFAEKLRIRSPLRKAQALADCVLPLWSHHHSVANWWRALKGLNATDHERLAALHAIDAHRLPDITGARATLPDDPSVLRKMFAEVLYTPGKPVSRVQTLAFQELLARRPPSTQLLMMHPPYRQDFADMLVEMRGIESKDEMCRFVKAARADSIHVEWFESPDTLSFTDDDFAPDGIHASLSGLTKYEKHFAQRYRQWVPLADGPDRSTMTELLSALPLEPDRHAL